MMTPERFQQVHSLFHQALDLAPSEQSSFLKRACAEEPWLEAEVIRLLAQNSLASREGFLSPGNLAPPNRGTTPTFSRADSTGIGKPRSTIAVVFGEGPPEAGELHSFLRKRMRWGTLIVLGSFGTFLLSQFFTGYEYFKDASRVEEFTLHVTVMAIAATASAILWSSHLPLSLRALHAIELTLLGASAAFFVKFQWDGLQWAVDHAHAYSWENGDSVISLASDSSMLRWFAFLVTYGAIMPNRWGRCAVILTVIALVPLALIVIIGIQRDCLWTRFDGPLFDAVIWMGIGTSVGVFATYKISHLSRQVSEARTLGAYQLRQLLGKGGMGEVFIAEHQRLHQPFAVKVIRPEWASDPESRQRFDREVKLTAGLKHPNTVRVLDYSWVADGTLYYVMEYLHGLTMRDLVFQHGRLSPERSIFLLRQICGALAEAHAKGLIHRDIKPSNIMVSECGGDHDVAKLLDFGLVQNRNISLTASRVDGCGLGAGTPAYMSPEQALGIADLDPRSDLYSLGAVAYFLATGRPPFEAKTNLLLLRSHIYEPQPPLAGENEALPTDLCAVITRCLEKDPRDRYPDAESLDAALGKCSGAGSWDKERAREWWAKIQGMPM